MGNYYFSDETGRNYHSCKYDEMSSVGMVWAAIMTMIALIQLYLA
jgi:hypothetical protein